MRHVLSSLLVAMVCCVAAPARSQTLRAVGHHPDCALARPMYDNPLPRTGWVMRRYEWHVGYALTTGAVAYGVHRFTSLPGWMSAAGAVVVIGIVPHVTGWIRGSYPIDLRDWGFDLWNRSLPLWVLLGRGRDRTTQALAASTYVAGYFALACYASP